ncbi:type II toxin-antitoxin system RelE/ParE family toxin [Candidatus Margulisiibacteriota bacterium]
MSSNYDLEFSNQARKFIKKLKDKKLLSEFAAAFENLKKNPHAGKFLQGDLKGYHSLRIGKYRIIYSIYRLRLMIFIERISHRKESYR